MSAPASPPPLQPIFPGGCECSRKNQDLMVFPLFEECDWPGAAQVIWYSFLMIYFFYAVSIVANIFMEAIEVITSKQKTIKNPRTGEEQVINVWNPTVANLTLMALGSSAPEILLAVIEVMVDNFESGELGPGTIVGSAAFNLLIIVAICIVAIPTGQVRRIEQYGVFIVTASCSIFAYLWLYIVLRVTSPDLIEIWEAVLTFMFFPILVGVSYIVDKGYHLQLGKKRISPTPDGAGGVQGVSGWVTRGIIKPAKLGVHEAVSLVKALRTHADGEIADEEIVGLVQALKPKSRAEERKQAMKLRKDSTSMKPEVVAKARVSVFKPDLIEEKPADGAALPPSMISESGENYNPVCFESKFYRVSERDGSVVVRALLQGTHDKPVTVAYTTRDGQGPNAAKAGQDYTHADGILTFAPGERRKEITIPIINDDEPEPDEDFEVALATPKATAAGGNDPKKIEFHWAREHLCKVLIIDDDRPGVLRWNDEETVFDGNGSEVMLTVFRYDGNRGDVAFRVLTEPMAVSGAEAAVVHKDFMPMDETLVMRNTVSDMVVSIPITTKTAAQHEKAFRVKLMQLTGDSAGKIDGQFSETTVRLRGNVTEDPHDDEYAKKVAEMINATLEPDHPRTYMDQFQGAFYPETDVKPNAIDWFFHIVVFPWKLLFAVIPPPTMCGGWPCFVAALFFIGFVTFFIQEIATIFGCVLGMAKACNAVIFVALGTSLPDALASKSAALNDLTADASVGNVTGSNCVNVFLGLGLPWLICSIYWNAVGPTNDWKRKYPKQAREYPDGGFVVPGDDLGFAVVTFVGAAIVCLLILGLRRNTCGGELGGPFKPKWASAAVFVMLWVTFITLYCTLAGEVTI